jgi:hypothetical protein
LLRKLGAKPEGSVKSGIPSAEGHSQDKLDVCQKFGVTNVFPDKEAVLQSVHPRVFRQASVEAAHWSEKNDRIDIIKVGGPGVSLSPVRVTLIR